MNTDLENRREDWERKHGDYYNPCKGCPNLIIEDPDSGVEIHCELGGGENCDRGDQDE